MPKRKYGPKRRRSFKKRRLVRYRKKRGYRMPPLICPTRKVVRLRYRGTFQLNATGGVVAAHTLSANGMFDPDITGTGHQPAGFDQWMVFYNHYTVLGARIKATFVSSSTSSTLSQSWIGCTVASGTSLGTTTTEGVLEKKHTRKGLIGSASSANGIKTITNYVSLKKYLGQRNVIDEDDNAGTASGNPTEQVYFICWQSPYAAFYDPDPVNVSFEITYIAMLHEPKQLSTS